MTAHHVGAFGLVFSCLMARLFFHSEKDLSNLTWPFLGFAFLVNRAVGLLGLRIYFFMTLNRY